MRSNPPGVLTVQTLAVVANTTVSIPAGYQILAISMRNTTANAVTGGIRIGTSDAGIDVAVAIAVAGSAIIGVPDATILKKYFSSSVATTLFVQAVTLWNSASLNISFLLGKME